MKMISQQKKRNISQKDELISFWLNNAAVCFAGTGTTGIDKGLFPIGNASKTYFYIFSRMRQCQRQVGY